MKSCDQLNQDKRKNLDHFFGVHSKKCSLKLMRPDDVAVLAQESFSSTWREAIWRAMHFLNIPSSPDESLIDCDAGQLF